MCLGLQAMQSIYWICFVGGGVFVFLAAVGGIDGADIDIAADVGLVEPGFDINPGLDKDLDFKEPQSPSQKTRWQFNPFILIGTLKFWTFGSCFFGLTGILLSYFQPQRSPVSNFVISLLMGLFIGTLVALTFHILRFRAPTGMTQAEDYVGLVGSVELPISQSNRGKIRVQFQDRSRELLARTSDDVALEVGDRVMIVGMEENQAWVVAESTLHEPETP